MAKQTKTTPSLVPATFDHRTAEGRAAYDAAVLAAIKSFGSAGELSGAVIARAGGTPAQFRASIKRLGDKIAKSGATSYTRYAAKAA